MDETTFQQANFKLRKQEYPYYYEAYRSSLPTIPELGDDSGGFSNATYFNFVCYIMWKVIARHVPDEATRLMVTAEAGRQLASRLVPDVLQQVADRGAMRRQTQPARRTESKAGGVQLGSLGSLGGERMENANMVGKSRMCKRTICRKYHVSADTDAQLLFSPGRFRAL
jgi:hypothetical protein